MMRSLLALTFTAALAAGCGSFSRAIEYSDPRVDAAGKTFAVTPGKANIYVYRDQAYLGETALEVVLDEQWSAKTVGQTYFVVEVDSGMHLLRSRGDPESTLDVYVARGQNVFVWLQVSPSVVTVRGRMEVKDETEGKTGVQQCRRVDAFE